MDTENMFRIFAFNFNDILNSTTKFPICLAIIQIQLVPNAEA